MIAYRYSYLGHGHLLSIREMASRTVISSALSILFCIDATYDMQTITVFLGTPFWHLADWGLHNKQTYLHMYTSLLNLRYFHVRVHLDRDLRLYC